jgi:opine dehydrogenase
MKIVYPEIIPVSDVLYTSLDCVNWLVHPAKTLLHKGLIERSKHYSLLQKDSIPPSVIKIMEAMDIERISLGKAFGLDMTPIRNFWESGGKNIYEAIMGSEEVKTYSYEFEDGWVKYLDEDLYFAFPPLISLAKIAKINISLFEAILYIFSVITGIDYMNEGVTTEKMGLAGLSVREIKNILNEGF